LSIILCACFESVVALNFLPILLRSPIFFIYLATVFLETFIPSSNSSAVILGLLNNWLKEIETIDKILKSVEVHNEEKEIWKNMYLKVAFKLEKLENGKSED